MKTEIPEVEVLVNFIKDNTVNLSISFGDSFGDESGYPFDEEYTLSEDEYVRVALPFSVDFKPKYSRGKE